MHVNKRDFDQRRDSREPEEAKNVKLIFILFRFFSADIKYGPSLLNEREFH